ncbi:hypothetical protein RQM47_04535 [Rubrivirga sp. S365]|uniref:Pre-peptidase C-terminal domain-containing protein n=1 Tax=Rubrivirga litoralis TaxID=3075598 RepID=A0ABU3BM65_9BACT|nr:MULTISPECIES: hypothetical protein [unclassified Rubrivirga]MDT0630389.1 hypothetical protein [Rubrivirga sp. F394]MDT7855900.1 hypothetical protein [Rubrivirga sp. S365]
MPSADPPARLPSDPPPRPAPGGAEAEPSLRAHLAAQWRAWPLWARWGGVAVLVALLAWALTDTASDVAEGANDEDMMRQVALARAEWADAQRQAPQALDRRPAEGTLGPGDAERDDGRYADYYAFEADSLDFSVLVTSDDFAPDLSVRRPDGQTVAASNLLRTEGRAEIEGLQGPGRFVVEVSPFEPGTSGAYVLEVVPAGPADSLFVDEEPRLDTLGQGARRGPRYERAYGVMTGSEVPVLLRVVSPSFTPRLHLFGPNGEVRGSWRTVERRASGDSLRAVVIRYLPGWDAPYRLLVTSEEAGAEGAYALDVRSLQTYSLGLGEEADGALGDDSWLVDGRYVDTYRLRVPDGVRTRLVAASEVFPPALRVWRLDGRSRKDVADAANPAGGPEATVEGRLDAGDYFVEVSSGGEWEPGDPARGGDYTLASETEAVEPPPPTAAPPGGRYDGPAPPTKVFATEVRREGESGESTFEVGVTTVAISYPGETRTRVQLSVTVRSVDYSGGWAPWERFAAQSYLVDDTGRRYAVSAAESTSPSGPTAEPGTSRRGTVVLYAPEVARDLRRLVFVASIGERSLTLPIPVP